MADSWTLTELVAEVATRIAALPAPSNGQVRAIPDERTIRYYGTIGLLDRPDAMRGRTALYGRRHLAQVVAIKRLQTMGRSLAEIQALWPTLDDHTLGRMAGVALGKRGARAEFWKKAPADTGARTDAAPAAPPAPPAPVPAYTPAPAALSIELAPNITLTIAMPDDIAVSSADVHAIRAAAAPLVSELARRRLAAHPGEEP